MFIFKGSYLKYTHNQIALLTDDRSAILQTNFSRHLKLTSVDHAASLNAIILKALLRLVLTMV